jgi:hypothetical protein
MRMRICMCMRVCVCVCLRIVRVHVRVQGCALVCRRWVHALDPTGSHTSPLDD